MSFKDKFKNFFYLEEEELEQTTSSRQPMEQRSYSQDQPVVRPVKKRQVDSRPPVTEEGIDRASNVVSLQNVMKSSKVILVEPRVYAEAQDIAEHLKNKRAVVVNLQKIDKEQGIRIVDFLSGTTYALGGDIQRIGTDIFLCAPDNVEVAGSISDQYFQD